MMEKRVYGVIGIASIMSNWNADFSGMPKTLSNGTIFGSDKALKYPIKRMWVQEGRKVLYTKSLRFEEMKNEGNILIPRTLKERYEYLFPNSIVSSKTDLEEILKNLFSAVDVKNFGATFAEEGANISITGAVQFGQGLNKYAQSISEVQDILSPFRDPKAKVKDQQKKVAVAKKNADGSDADVDVEGLEARQSTLGTKIMSDEAHYFYPFNINPFTYRDYVELGVTQGYTEDDYLDFKRVSRMAATSFASNAKAGCDTEFALFVETNKDLYLPNLTNFIAFEKGEEKNRLILGYSDLLSQVKPHILSIETYYNPYTTELVGEIKGERRLNIYSGKEV